MTHRREVDIFRGRRDGGRLVAEFGRKGDHAVVLTDRVSLKPETARRLILAIDGVLQRMPKAAFAAAAPLAGRAADLSQRGAVPLNAQPDEAGARAAELLAQVEALGAPFRYERSFRMSRAGLQANRFLVTVTQSDIAGDARARVLAICRAHGMPDELANAALPHFARAGAVHLGFEAGTASVLVKLYLEQALDAHRSQEARARGEPLLQHIAFKWEPGARPGAGVVTRYLWHPLLSLDALRARLAHVYRDAGASSSAAFALDLLGLAASRVPVERLQYLEVAEEGNARRSFDLNVYDTGLRVEDLRGVLHALRDRYDIRPGRFQALYDQVKSRPLGHIAGGVHRDGGDFFNIYHAAA